MFETAWEGLLFAAAAVAVIGVALYFELTVNRVFDVPKAVALKSVAGGAALVWLGFSLWGPGVRWRSTRVFAAPVLALTAAFAISTLLSIDVETSLYGVYERQFGFQGFLGCVGLYFVVTTTAGGRRAAILGLALVALLGAMLGAYAFVQSQGHDPWPFFREPHNKVYAFLGNATFAGNALALIFPISSMLGIVALSETRRSNPDRREWLIGVGAGLLGVVVLLVLPGYILGAGLEPGDPGGFAQGGLRVGFVAATLLLFGALASGTSGHKSFRLSSEQGRRRADAVAAGALVACGLLIVAGIFYTRTRGAWVGMTMAVFAGLVLLPRLFKDEPLLYRRVRVLCWAILGVLAVSLSTFVVLSDSLPARTIRSIPAAFDSTQSLGKGQGTRPYLWSESIRVLTQHGDTLNRIAEDSIDRGREVRGPLVEDMPFREARASSAGIGGFERAWRSVSVWLFGIGIETYRYAFMSHKSKRLEALDPMTNHDNPHNNYLYILASLGIVGLAAYLWLLFQLVRQSFARFQDVRRPRAQRALAFGVVTSFFSYAVYSIAGFDSVACSVFFYFVLGLSAVFFEPPSGDERRSLPNILVEAMNRFRPMPPSKQVIARHSFVVMLGVGVGGLLIHTAWSGWSIYRAERAFTGRSEPGRNTLEKRLADIHTAIRINTNESYYKQMLGSTHAQGAVQYMQRARQLQQAALQTKAKNETQARRLLVQAQALRRTAEKHTQQARIALYAALENAWAPENIFASLFQALYAIQDDEGSERALVRALRHSPHLGAYRANLAALRLARGDWEAALEDCRRVLEVAPKNALAARTCAKALMELGRLDEARKMLDRAEALAPRDPRTERYRRDLESKTSTSRPSPSPSPATSTTQG